VRQQGLLSISFQTVVSLVVSLRESQLLSITICFFPFVVLGIELKDLTRARQMLYHLNYGPSSFAFSLFSAKVSR
jgi:hypothetical protein